jgi:hypothetical protein
VRKRKRPLTGREEREREKLRREAEPPLGDELLAYRYENGLDLWTGRPIAEEDLADWRELRAEAVKQEDVADKRLTAELDRLIDEL